MLNQALSDLRVAALAASAHRRRSHLAADVGTKTAILFPRAGRHTEQTGPTGDDNDFPPPLEPTRSWRVSDKPSSAA